MKKWFKYWLNKLFIRDIQGYLTIKGFFYFLIAFIFSTISINYAIVFFLSINPEQIISILGLTSALALLSTILIAGIIVDKIKNRMRLLLVSSFLTLCGLILVSLGGIFEIIGFSAMIFFIGIVLVDILTILTHESTILNRGRLYGYLFFISFTTSNFLIMVTFGNIFAIILIESIFFIGMYLVSRKYTYTETKKRLSSNKSFFQIITGQYNVFGYMIAFGVLGYVIGNAYHFDIEVKIDPIIFLFTFTIFFLIFGLFLDNIGRKRSFATIIVFISSLAIFTGLFQNEFIYNAIFLGVSIPSTFSLLFTLTSDFSTERNTLKYRGRIASTFIVFVALGFLSGILQRLIMTEIYSSDTISYYWMPVVIEGFSPFLLILLLVWILPLPEILSPKEADWAQNLRNLYIFSKDSICLFPKSFLREENAELPAEDLITGGLTGVLHIVSEITNEKKNLRIIDKGTVKIFFSYGKYVNSALISTKFLPVLFKKLDMFTKAFEKQFERELVNFTGKIDPFLNNTDSLIMKYFR